MVTAMCNLQTESILQSWKLKVTSEHVAQILAVSLSAAQTQLYMFRTSQLFIYNAAFSVTHLALPSGGKQHATKISRDTHSGLHPHPFHMILGCKNVNVISYPRLKVNSPLTVCLSLSSRWDFMPHLFIFRTKFCHNAVIEKGPKDDLKCSVIHCVLSLSFFFSPPGAK